MIKHVDHWRTEDEYGKVMPWYTRKCCEWLSELKLENKRVFEYGSGQSAIWWRFAGCTVLGVDHQEEWARFAEVEYEEQKEYYLAKPTFFEKFDIICIDGEWRDECIDYALECLNEGGFIIIDNWKQGSADLPHWPNTEKVIKMLKLKVTEYKEPEHIDWKTLVIER